MQAPGDGEGGAAGGAEGGAGSREGEGGPRPEGAEGEAVRGPSPGRGCPAARGAPWDVPPEVMFAPSRLLEFKLTVPFRTPLEAEMARRSLAPYVQRPRGLVQKELTVNGSALAIRWTAEDPVFFRISVNAFLDQLSLVMRNIRGFGSPPMRSLGRGKRTDT
ncbi:EKC/KEOPS complex subunit LAGE3-like [Canis lupus familiaris]|uniref:EKC/KEOPS complex subunit LAGE3-like n=2 Tax=Canis lupus familiaris TaxID=9615 RepID=UPI0018F29C53|nr:EKC/KEOPS complex subunit LAGE3-like [Canis lupus familiaris]